MIVDETWNRFQNLCVWFGRIFRNGIWIRHYSDVMMSAIASQITSLAIVYSAVYSGADQRIHQSSASLAFERVIHRWPVNSPHKWPVTRKMFLNLMTSSWWNTETTLGGGFIGSKMAESDGQVSVDGSDIFFINSQFMIWIQKSIDSKHGQLRHFDKMLFW